MALPVIPIVAGALLLMSMKKKDSTTEQTGAAGSGGQAGAVASGSPKIEVKRRDINPLLNSVEFTVFWPDGSKNKYRQRRANGPIQKMVGEYILNTKFGSRTVKVLKDGTMKEDPMGALDIIVSNKDRKPLTAKRVILEDKNVVDIL